MIWKAGIWQKYYASIDHNEIKHESNVAWGFLAYSLLYNPGD